jgi:HPr kinase/phosphorylase
MSGPVAVHATCIVVGEAGILLRGRPGAGKSTLARRIVENAGRRGRFARLVSDDRVLVEPRAGRLLARAHGTTAGLIEARGLGLMRADHEAAAIVRLVVDVGGPPLDRMPEKEDLEVVLQGVPLLRLAAGPEEADRVLLHLDGTILHAIWNPT